MTVPSNEPVTPGGPPVDNGNPDPNQNAGHPAWQEILDVLPESLHGLVKPTLEKWDQGVQEKVQQVQQQYDPYKTLIQNGVQPDMIEQALYLANLLETEPETVIDRAIEHFNLEKYQQTVAPNNDEGSTDMTDGVFEGLEDDPRFKALLEQQEQFNEWMAQQQQEREAVTNQNQLNSYLQELHTQHGNFDDLYVTALLANGVDGEVAVKQFNNTVNQAAQALAGQQQTPQVTPPVVMGAGGTTGSGQPDQTVKFEDMNKGDFNSLVAQYIQQANANET